MSELGDEAGDRQRDEADAGELHGLLRREAERVLQEEREGDDGRRAHRLQRGGHEDERHDARVERTQRGATAHVGVHRRPLLGQPAVQS